MNTPLNLSCRGILVLLAADPEPQINMAAQIPDRISLHGEWLDLYSNPLEQYWIRTEKKRPSFYPLPDCKRGYIASWEIKRGRLFLNEVDGNFEKYSFFFGKRPARYSLKILFPKCDYKLVQAIWFSGKLRVPQGKMTQYEHKAYDSRFEKELIITIERGEVLKTVTIDNHEKTAIVDSGVITM